LEKTDSELGNGRCPIHPNISIDVIEEENYFFRFSRYQKPLLDYYKQNPQFIIPLNRFREIINFVKNGLEDFSVSRLKSKMPWGIDVPDDPEHVMYVWFDALIFYISSIGWPEKIDFDGYWPGIQVAGKDNLRQQSAIWQAMLISAGLPNSKQIYIHGFISADGQKISKSLGNIIDPYALVKKYGIDAVRYYLLREIPSYDDGDFSERRFKELYNADLANGLGNLVARIAKLATNVNGKRITVKFSDVNTKEFSQSLDEFRFNDTLEIIWKKIKSTDQYVNDKQPWKLTGERFNTVLQKAISDIIEIATLLQPFLPDATQKILDQFKSPTITPKPPLFPRIT